MDHIVDYIEDFIHCFKSFVEPIGLLMIVLRIFVVFFFFFSKQQNLCSYVGKYPVIFSCIQHIVSVKKLQALKYPTPSRPAKTQLQRVLVHVNFGWNRFEPFLRSSSSALQRPYYPHLQMTWIVKASLHLKYQKGQRYSSLVHKIF